MYEIDIISNMILKNMRQTVYCTLYKNRVCVYIVINLKIYMYFKCSCFFWN